MGVDGAKHYSSCCASSILLCVGVVLGFSLTRLLTSQNSNEIFHAFKLPSQLGAAGQDLRSNSSSSKTSRSYSSSGTDLGRILSRTTPPQPQHQPNTQAQQQKAANPVTSSLNSSSRSSFNEALLSKLLKHAAAFAPAELPSTVVIAEVNHGFVQMAFNLYKQLQVLDPPLKNIVWVALDEGSKAFMEANFTGALISHDHQTNFSSLSTRYRTPEYNRIVKHKWILLERVLALGYNALILDIDTVLLRNPFIYFRSAPACDLTVYENGLPSLEGPNKWKKRDWSSRFEVNTGFILARNSAATKALVHDFINSDVAVRHPGLDDQALFNRFMAERKWNASGSSSLLLSLKTQSTQCGQWKGVSVHILPPVLFASWRHFFESRVFDWTLQTPFLVHYNYLTGFASKMSKMRQHGFWHV